MYINPKLVVFDCDGVLVDSELLVHQLAAEHLSLLGCSLSLEESLQKFTGKNAQAIRDLIFQETGIEVSEEFWKDSQRKILEAFSTDLSSLIPEVLEHLKKHSVARCVASSSHRTRVCHALQATHQLSYFQEEHIFTSQQVKHGKPAPDLFLFAAQKMQYLPQDCIVIEDSVSGIEAALAANMPVIGFLGGTHAQYEWYHQRLKAYDIPIAHNAQELLLLLNNELHSKKETYTPSCG